MRAFRLLWLMVCVVLLMGCGGDGTGVPAPPGGVRVETGETVIGPLVMRPAAAASMQIETVSNAYGLTFTVFSGATIDYIAVRELMDRVAFVSRRTGDLQVFTSDFFGDNPVQFTFNSQPDNYPAWSPDGTRLAWSYSTASYATEIFIRDVAGGAATQLTNHPANDSHPTWSPDGRWIAFESNRSLDFDICKMAVDGSNQMDLIGDGMSATNDIEPDWAPDSSKIIFVSDRSGSDNIYLMNADGSNQQVVLNNTDEDVHPAWHPNGETFAYRKWVPTGTLHSEIYTSDTASTVEKPFTASANADYQPCYSSDGEYIFFTSQRTGDAEIWAKQVSFPYRLYQITNSPDGDAQPDLGCPTVQISRVLIGPNGSDHGYDPIHDAAVAGVVVHGYTGYLNFVRLGVPSSSGTTLTATPLGDAGYQVVGVLLSAADMYYVEEDAGLGLPPVTWDFSGLTSRSAILYFNARSGKLVAVMDMGDSVYSASAGEAQAISHERNGSSTIVRGQFRRVYGADGELVAEGNVGMVEIDAAGRVTQAF